MYNVGIKKKKEKGREEREYKIYDFFKFLYRKKKCTTLKNII